MNGSKQIKGGAVISYASIAFNIISGLLYTPWMIHTIGDSQYALYTLALSIINIFLMDFGIGSAVTKFLSNYYARGEKEKANQFMGIVYKVFIAISVVIAVALMFFYFFINVIYTKFTPQELVTFKKLFIIVSMYSVLSFPFMTFNGILMANERFIELKTCNLVQKVFSVCMIVFFLLLGKGVYALVLVQAISNVLILLAKYFVIRRQTSQRVNWSGGDKVLVKSLFNFSIWITVVSLAQRCIFNIMPTLIATLIGAGAVTLFSLSSTLEGYVYIFADAINGMFMPRISRILVQDNVGKKLSIMMCKVGRFHVYTIGLIYIGFVCVGRQFVELWLGTGYEVVYVCTLLLIFPSLIDVPQQVARTTLLAKDIVKEQALIYVGMAGINVILSLLFIPMCGVYGAAIAICVAYLFRTAVMNYLYWKKLPIDLIFYFRNTYGRWLVAGVVTIVLGIFIAKTKILSGWIALGCKIILISGIYAICVWIVCLNKKEKTAVLSTAKKVLKKSNIV